MALAALALVVRVLHLVDFSRLPIFEDPTVDAALYVEFARRFAESGTLPGVFFKPPLFPVVLGAWWSIVGESWFWLRMPFALLGAGTTLLTWWMGRRLFTPTVALLGGLFYALCSSAVYFEGELLEIGLVTFVHAGALLLVMYAANSRRGLAAFLCGVGLGVGIVARPTLLLFAVVACAVVGRRRLVWAVLGLLVALAPVTLHNAFRGRDFVLVSANAGLNFYIGNNPKANGRITSTPELPAAPARARREARRIAEADAGHPLKPSEVSDYWLRRGVEYSRAQPVRTAHTLMLKMFFLWSGTPLSDNEDLQSLPRYLRVYALLPIGMWLLAPLGLLGLFAARAARRSAPASLWLARGFVAAQVLAVWPFFVVERFRLPWTPVLAVFAAWCVVELIARVRHAPRRAWPLALAAVALLVACNVPAFGVREPPLLDLDYKLAYAYHQQGRLDEALAAYRHAAENNPRAAPARNALGYLLAERGENLDEAARWVQEAIAIDPARTANYAESLAFVELQRGDAAAAVVACNLGLRSEPDDRTRTLLYLRRAEAQARLGNHDEVRNDARRALEIAPNDELRLRAERLIGGVHKP